MIVFDETRPVLVERVFETGADSPAVPGCRTGPVGGRRRARGRGRGRRGRRVTRRSTDLGIPVLLDRPGGNITGFAGAEATLGGKWLELLSEIAPGLKRVAIMFNPDTAPASAYVPSFETAARSLKIVPISTPVAHSDLVHRF